jgi:hypothetical protein
VQQIFGTPNFIFLSENTVQNNSDEILQLISLRFYYHFAANIANSIQDTLAIAVLTVQKYTGTVAFSEELKPSRCHLLFIVLLTGST